MLTGAVGTRRGLAVQSPRYSILRIVWTPRADQKTPIADRSQWTPSLGMSEQNFHGCQFVVQLAESVLKTGPQPVSPYSSERLGPDAEKLTEKYGELNDTAYSYRMALTRNGKLCSTACAPGLCDAVERTDD